ncbi:peptide deformylase [Temperatibacter marinus]|uniref:Peptide deformylase-like n=1 Tax=Temperatibacter marinus TaxID=1456591 RepID=A0AA52H9E0_9PROT|nr:peptide deformylase [Temperatibacter marinus]WND03096.1 peptide deformylase [Temperatibacter marinus]
MISLRIAPDPILRKTAKKVTHVTDELRGIIRQMYDLLYAARGIGLGANMVGLLERIVIVDLQDGDHPKVTMINPVITWHSEEMQSNEEASLCFPGISAEVTRPLEISVTYLDETGHEQTLQAAGWFAQVIQHEIDYLDGKIYLDYLSKMKRDRLMKKMEKYKKAEDNKHVHSSNCGPGCSVQH